MTVTLADYADHFAANPDGFLIGKTRASTHSFRGGITQHGEADTILFSMERIENRLDLQKYVNVIAYVDGRVLSNVFEHEGVISANIWGEDEGPTKNYALQTDTFTPSTPSPEDQAKILRWKQKLYKEYGMVNPAQEFDTAENEAALKFFTALFSGPESPEVDHLQKGIEILSRRVDEMKASGKNPLKVGDPVEFTDGRRAKIVELFPNDDKVVILTPLGQTALVPYADVTKVK